MKRVIGYTFLVALLLCGVVEIQSARAECFSETGGEDTLSVSFITCEPGPLIYELYGHSAIRIRNTGSREFDLAFNYGMFDFNTPNFVWRFLLGKTDYHMAAYPFADFVAEYEQRGSAVIEQQLNLTAVEKQRLVTSLVTTAMREDWTYRYNFFYDNCTTRARDEIEKCLDGRIVYPTDSSKETESYRSIVHKYTDGNPWSEFGEDLLLGQAADEPIDYRQKMFAPMYMEKYNDGALVIDSAGAKRRLVGSTKVYPPTRAMSEVSGFPIPPIGVFGAWLAIVVGVCFMEIRTERVVWGIEALMMTVQGVAGCLIALLFFFSEHPTVSTNWLLMLLNPIPLLYMPMRIIKTRGHRFDIYAPVAMVWILLFIIISVVVPQTFNASIYCFALSLLLQTATATYIQHKAAWKR